jgi:glutamine synthetase
MTSKPAKSQSGFIARHGLWSDAQADAAKQLRKRIKADGLELVRFSFPDQHGILRGKAIMADALDQAFSDGCALTTTLLAKDTSHKTVFPVFETGGGFDMAQMTGGGDFILVPDPATFAILPWAHKTGWLLCDIYFKDGEPVPFATRDICRQALARLKTAGFDMIAGIEVECHLFRLDDLHLEPEHSGQPAAAPAVSLLGHGFQYLTEQRFDGLEPVLELLRKQLVELGLPLRSIEVEFGPSQCEFTFAALPAQEAADLMILFRSAVKQICRRHGLHASFMCRPALANLFSSGWHLHQSLTEADKTKNLFAYSENSDGLSDTGLHYIGGLLQHAAAACVFTTPTINGFKRYQSNSLAPDRAVWGRDNRGVMIRQIGDGGPNVHIENRIGEPAANPYLYVASQALSGLDGIEQRRSPGPPVDEPYRTKAPPLPDSLADAVDALVASAFFRAQLGDRFVDYIAAIKRAEISRFNRSVTDWEQREYFDIF